MVPLDIEGRREGFVCVRALTMPSHPAQPIHRRAAPGVVAASLAAVLATATTGQASAETWRGLAVAPEHRCAPYDRGDYPYPQSVEPRIVASMGGRVFGPYTGRYFAGRGETDVEHMVATSEAHDSGLCAADAATRRRFAGDLLNLTLASPDVNRHQKGGKDAGEWMPRRNRCWFAGRVVAVRLKYGLTVDAREARALERVLSGCASTGMDMAAGQAPAADSTPGAAAPGAADALRRYDDNRNGRITCKEARKHGIAPVRREHPAYRFMRDGDGDGVVCE